MHRTQWNAAKENDLIIYLKQISLNVGFLWRRRRLFFLFFSFVFNFVFFFFFFFLREIRLKWATLNDNMNEWILCSIEEVKLCTLLLLLLFLVDWSGFSSFYLKVHLITGTKYCCYGNIIIGLWIDNIWVDKFIK